MTVAGACQGLPLGAVIAQPQAERWKRDRKPTNSRLQVATNPVPEFTRERGSEAKRGSTNNAPDWSTPASCWGWTTYALSQRSPPNKDTR